MKKLAYLKLSNAGNGHVACGLRRGALSVRKFDALLEGDMPCDNWTGYLVIFPTSSSAPSFRIADDFGGFSHLSAYPIELVKEFARRAARSRRAVVASTKLSKKTKKK